MTDHELLELSKLVPFSITQEAISEGYAAQECWQNRGYTFEAANAASRAAIQVSLIFAGALEALCRPSPQ